MLWSMAWPRIQHLLVFFFPYLNDRSFSVLVRFSQPLSVHPRTQTLVFSFPRSFILMTLNNIHWIIISKFVFPILIPWASDSYICLLSSSTWMQNRHSKFNLSKTEILILSPQQFIPLTHVSQQIVTQFIYYLRTLKSFFTCIFISLRVHIKWINKPIGYTSKTYLLSKTGFQ